MVRMRRVACTNPRQTSASGAATGEKRCKSGVDATQKAVTMVNGSGSVGRLMAKSAMPAAASQAVMFTARSRRATFSG